VFIWVEWMGRVVCGCVVGFGGLGGGFERVVVGVNEWLGGVVGCVAYSG